MGQEIQGYRIMKPIGQGKFSTVYKAENSEGQPVAVKKIKVNQSASSDIRHDGSQATIKVFEGGGPDEAAEPSQHHQVHR